MVQSERMQTKQQLRKTLALKGDMLTWLISKKILTPETDGRFDIVNAASQVFRFCYGAVSIHSSAAERIKRVDDALERIDTQSIENERRVTELENKRAAIERELEELERELEGHEASLDQLRTALKRESRHTKKTPLKLVRSTNRHKQYGVGITRVGQQSGAMLECSLVRPLTWSNWHNSLYQRQRRVSKA